MNTLIRFQRALGKSDLTPMGRLHVLNVVYEKDPDVVAAREHRHMVFATLAHIRDCAENGRIAVIESGMDCDCVQYDGVVHECDATIQGYRALCDRIAESSDGRFYLRIVKPSDAQNVKYRSRDRAFEAYENGHAGYVTYGSLD